MLSSSDGDPDTFLGGSGDGNNYQTKMKGNELTITLDLWCSCNGYHHPATPRYVPDSCEGEGFSLHHYDHRRTILYSFTRKFRHIPEDLEYIKDFLRTGNENHLLLMKMKEA